MINLVIHGSSGKFGKIIINYLKENKEIKYVGCIERTIDVRLFFDNLLFLKNIVILDISSDIGCKKLLEDLINNKIYHPLIIGSTGVLPDNLINEYSIEAPVAQISNFSDGISSILDVIPRINIPNMKTQIYETHHIHKKDAPSGTSKTLADKIKLPYSNIYFSRHGEIYGNHEIIYENEYEKITIKHEVLDKNIFAIGCVKWIKKINNLSIGIYRN